MAYQLIAVDMDGTLLNSQKEITPRTEAAVTAALARGYHVVMTTGRCYRQIVPYMAQFPAMRYAITSSGAAVADCAQDRIISAQNLPADVAAELVRAFEGLDGFPILFFNGEALYRPDVVLFDVPPLQAADDSIGFLKSVDCALLVVAAEETPMGQIDVAERQVSELTGMLGLVLNKCRMSGGDYGYEYYDD